MTCEEFERQFSDYIEQTLDQEHRAAAEGHRATCAVCHSLTDGVLEVINACRNFPEVEPGEALIQRVLQSTTGKKAPLSPFRTPFKSIFHPGLFPKFAIGAVLIVCFVSFVINFLGPSASGSQASAVHKADVFMHQLYSRGLRIYDKVAQWQAEFKTFTASLMTKIDYHIGQMGEQLKPEPEEEKPKEEPKDQKQKKSSIEPYVFAQRNRPYARPVDAAFETDARCKLFRPCAMILTL